MTKSFIFSPRGKSPYVADGHRKSVYKLRDNIYFDMLFWYVYGYRVRFEDWVNNYFNGEVLMVGRVFWPIRSRDEIHNFLTIGEY